MGKTFLVFIFITMLVSSMSYLTERKRYDVITDADSKANVFIRYAFAFDEYYVSNSSATGDVSKQVNLPSWIAVDPTIRAYISNGVGYVFMPLSTGLFSAVLAATSNSSMIGVSDSGYITTVSGKLSKPSFIPSGYIVYVR